MKFCNTCNNILTVSTANNELEFVCVNCDRTYKSNPDDSLLIDVIISKEKKIDNSEIGAYINSVKNDNVANLTFKECPACHCTISKQILVESSIYICNDCGNVFK